MKTAFQICGTLTVLFSLLFCSFSISKAQEDKKAVVNMQIAQCKEQSNSIAAETKTRPEKQVSKAERQLQEQRPASTYLIIQIFLFVLILLALTFGVLLFRPDLGLTKQLLGAAVLVTFVTYFMSPDSLSETFSGMETGTSVLLSGFPVVVAGVFALQMVRRNTSRIVIQIN